MSCEARARASGPPQRNAEALLEVAKIPPQGPRVAKEQILVESPRLFAALISFYTATSIGPVLFIVIAIAGLAFGHSPPPASQAAGRVIRAVV